MKLWKRTGLGAAAVALCCVVLLAAGWLPWAGLGQRLSIGEEQTLFFQGNSPAAVLVAADEGAAYRPLVRALQKSGVPVLVAFHPPEEDMEQGLSRLSREAALLKQKTGLSEKDIFLLGYGRGAAALLDQLVKGGQPWGGMVIAAPDLPASLKEATLVVDGSYSTQNQWLAGLSSNLVLQPTLLLSSAADQVCDAYTMTLLYHYLSGDEIIHMGGIYQAHSGPLSLDIVDGGSHAMAASHPATVARALEFFSQNSGVPVSLYWMEPMAGAVRFLLLAAVGLMGLCTAKEAQQRLCTVSYAIYPKGSSPAAGRLLGKKALCSLAAVAAGVVLLYPACLLFPQVSPPLLLFYGAAWGYGLAALAGGKKQAAVVQNGRGQVLLGALSFAPALALLAIPFYGYPCRIPRGRSLFALLWGAVGLFLWLRALLKEEELFRENTGSLPAQLGLWLLHLLPLAALAVLYGLFSGGISAFAQPLALLGWLAMWGALALGAFSLWGSASWAALAAALLAQGVALFF